MMMIDDTLVDLDFPALYRLAEYHDKQATVLRARAHRLEQRHTDNRHIDRRLQFLEKLPQTVCKYLRQGHSAAQACELTSTHTEVALATVQAHWRRFLTEKSETSMAQRNRLIMDLAALGLTNAQIGDRVGLHGNSVSRIISAEKKRRLVWDRAPEPSAQLVPPVDLRKNECRPALKLTSSIDGVNSPARGC